MATAGCDGESEEEEEEQEETMEVGVRELEPDHQLTQAVQSSRNVTLKGEINMGGSINKTENKYEDHRVIHKTRQIVCGNVNNVTNAQNLTVQHHHGDVHHVTNIIQPEINTAEGQAKNLINSDADVFVETSLYRQALDKLTGPGCVLLVTGPTKCGKSCLGHALLRHFTEDGYSPLVVNSMKAMSHVAKDKKHAILIDIEGFDEKFVESDVVRRLCKMAQVRNSLIVFAFHESCLSQEGDGDGEGARAYGAFQSLKISRSSTYSEKEKAEMLRKHLGREKKRVHEGLLQVVVSTETCGYLFPLRCLQYAEVVDDDDCVYDPILLFTHLENIIQCTRLHPVTVVEINTGNVSPMSESDSELYVPAIDECRQKNLHFLMKWKSDQKPDLDNAVPGETPLLKACRTGDTETVKELLKSKKENPNYQTHECITPLHLACLAGSEAIVDLLLESGAKADAVDSDGLTPLHCACRQGNPAVVESIIKTFNVPAPPDADRVVLKCTSGHQELVKALRACTLNQNMASSSTSLQVCTTCLAQCRPALDNVRRHDKNINMRIMKQCGEQRPTALHIACVFSHLEAVERLLENGACTELGLAVREFTYMSFLVYSTPLVLACALGLTDVVRLLLKHKACADPLHEVTALHVASYYGRSDVVQLLLDNGADAEATDIDGNLPLHRAFLWHSNPDYEPDDSPNLIKDMHHFKVCQLLLKKMRPEAVRAKNKAKRCPLYEACVRNDLDTVHLLVKHGADVNQAADGVAALHIACDEGHNELVQLLIHLGADVNKQGKSWGVFSVCSPLRIACARCHADIVELLLKNKCKVDYDIVDDDGKTLLHLIGTRPEDGGDSVQRERLRRGGDSYANAETIAKLLLDTVDIDVNSSASCTGTPLQHFCDLGHLGIVSLLLKHEALVNPPQPDKEHYQQIASPLQLAVKFSIESDAQNRDEWRDEAEEIIHLLLQNDASVATLFDQGWRYADSTGFKGFNQPVLRYLINGSNAATILCQMLERGITTPDSEDNTYRVQAGEHIPKKETALHLACMLCCEDVVKTLLDKGADLSARDGNDMTPLMALCVYSCSYHYYTRQSVEQTLAILRILVERGEDMYSEDTKGRLPVQELSRGGDIDLQKLLDAKVVSVHGTDRQGRTLLHQLCAKSLQVPDVRSVTYGIFITTVSFVTILIKAGVNVNARDHNGDTPLHLACMQGHVAAVQDLLSGEDLELKANNEGKTPLDLATELEDVSLRTQLLQMLQSLENASGELPAADVRSVQINSQAPDGVEANSQREEPAACAVSQDVPEIASQVSPSEDVQGKGLSQTASLTSQAREKATQTRQDLLASAGHVTLQPDQGVDNVQLQSVESQDATHSSHNKPGQVDQWSLQLVDDMLTSGVPVDSLVDSEGLSPLHYACKEGDLHLAERLLSAGVDVNKTDVRGRTAVYFASERGDVMMLDLLLHHGCDVRVKDKQGLSAFHDACYHGHANAASILLSKGAEVKEVDVLGNTALHLACGQGHTEVAVTLLQGGARVMTQNNQGQTAMSLASSSGNELLVKVVERHIVEYGQGQGRQAEREKSQAERDRLWKVIAILVPSVIVAFIAAGFYFVDYHS